MKRIFLTVFITVFAIISFSQDVITKKNGDDIQAKVLEITPSEIKYKNFNNQDGPTITLPKSEVLMIRYQNGTKDVFNQDNLSSTISSNDLSNEEYFRKGQADASLYYKGYKGAGTTTLFVSLLSPLVGLIPAITCSSTPPKDNHLNYPNADLMRQADYFDGYFMKSRKIKKGKVWKNWSIGLGANLVAVLLLYSGR